MRWYEEGEKSTKYFLNLEKSNRNKTSIKKLIKPDSEIEITGFNEIQKEIKSFYQSLYSRKSLKKEKQCLDYLKDINTPKITTQQKMKCEEKLTVKECFDTLLRDRRAVCRVWGQRQAILKNLLSCAVTRKIFLAFLGGSGCMLPQKI